MNDTRNMTLRNLADYYDPKLPDSAVAEVPNGLLRELPTRDAAEGADDTAWHTALAQCADYLVEHGIDGATASLVREFIPDPVPSATPKPAPDAVREAQKQQNRNYATSAMLACIALADEVVCRGGSAADVAASLRDRISAPVPSPDGAGALQGLCETTLTERFVNPACRCKTYEGNLGPCKTFEVGQNGRCVYCDHELSCHPSATGAAEPDAQMLEYARRLNDIAVDVELAQGGLGGAANASDLRRIAQRIVATPPVREDREELKLLIMAQSNSITFGLAGKIADAILSLPVQPGAGEQEVLIQQCAKIASDEADTWIKGEAATAIGQAFQRACRQISFKISDLSRQPPQSSSDAK